MVPVEGRQTEPVRGRSEKRMSISGETTPSRSKPTDLGIAAGHGWKKRGCLRDPELPTWGYVVFLVALLGLSVLAIFA